MNYKSDYYQDQQINDPLESRHFEALMLDYKEAKFGGVELDNIKKWLRAAMPMPILNSFEFEITNPDKSDHFFEGGTGITNFGRSELGRYLTAIQQYGDSSLFVGHPMPTDFPNTDLALRRKNGHREDLSEFWKVFKSLK